MTTELRHILTGMATTLDTPAAVGRFLAHRSPDEWEGWSQLQEAPDFKAAYEAAADEEPQELPVDAQVAAATDALQQEQQHPVQINAAAPARAPVVMRAKVVVIGVEDVSEQQQNVTFTGVAASSYPTDGSDENNTFAKFSPMVQQSFGIMNPALRDAFALGDEFYVDYTLAKRAVPADRIGALSKAQRDKEASAEATFNMVRAQEAQAADAASTNAPNPEGAAPAAPAGNQG